MGTPCPSETCVVYIKRDVVGASGLGKKQVSFRHKRTKATQQDLSNYLFEHSSIGISCNWQFIIHVYDITLLQACNIVTWRTGLINCQFWGLRSGEHITYH